MAIIGLQGGTEGKLDIGKLMAKRVNVAVTALRSRSAPDKGRIVAEVRKQLWPLLERHSVRPVIGQTVPLPAAADAHRMMEEGLPSARSCWRRPCCVFTAGCGSGCSGR
jgi:NADPH:quinone reductase-like Zn-dependent oxidoreductase